VAVEAAGRSRVNRSDLEGLTWAWSHRRLVLFLGAGVSLEWGIPAWKNLVLELLFEQTKECDGLSATSTACLANPGQLNSQLRRVARHQPGSPPRSTACPVASVQAARHPRQTRQRENPGRP
jgi:hypothetical protein